MSVKYCPECASQRITHIRDNKYKCPDCELVHQIRETEPPMTERQILATLGLL